MVGLSSPSTEHSFGTKFFSAGLAACFADLCTFPLDTAKVRLQIQGEKSSHAGGKLGVSSKAVEQAFKYKGPIGTIRVIVQEEGFRGLYSGIVPGLQRQMCFASIRIGSYDVFRDYYTNLFKANPQKPTFVARMAAGITTGAIAIIIAQPTDVVKVRMQAQRAGVPARYNGTLHAYRTIAVTEGIPGLWKGMFPNIARNVVVNCSELVTYDILKEFIISKNLLSDNLPCHFVSAFGAGFCATVIASPVDVVKTRYMNSSLGQYKGVLECALKMYQEGGLFAFYKGFFPSYLRLGSWNIVMFITYEQLKRLISANRSKQPKAENIS